MTIIYNMITKLLREIAITFIAIFLYILSFVLLAFISCIIHNIYKFCNKCLETKKSQVTKKIC